MSTFCFSEESGNLTVEEVFPMGKAPKSIIRGGKLFLRDVGAEGGLSRSGNPWPLNSKALGVPPQQVKAAQAELANKGVHADFTKKGELIFRSRSHRNDVLAAYGMHDNDAGYGDRTER